MRESRENLPYYWVKLAVYSEVGIFGVWSMVFGVWGPSLSSENKPKS